MTHMHIPDGILPVWLWLSGLLVMVLALTFSLGRLQSMDVKKKIPLLGAVAAVMLVVMSLEVLPLAYHINLSVVAGILLGPALGFVAAFITNLMLAFMGHGGATVIGLNTILLGSEAVLGHTLFFLMGRRIPVFWRAAIVTVLTLFTTALILIGIVAISHVDAAAALLADDEPGHAVASPDSLSAFAVVVLSLGSIGWIIEAAITGAVVKFIGQVRPDLLQHGLHADKKDPWSP